jgi:hypothetical protein
MTVGVLQPRARGRLRPPFSSFASEPVVTPGASSTCFAGGHGRIEPRIRPERLRSGVGDLFARCLFVQRLDHDPLHRIGFQDLGSVIDRR